MRLLTLSAALLSTAFLLGCQEQASSPVGLDEASSPVGFDGLGPQFAPKKCVLNPDARGCGGDEEGGTGSVPANLTMTPRMNALGVATVVGDDGWLVLVTVFLEDLHVPDDLGAWEARLLASVNRIRVEHRLSPQFASSDLSRIARLHSEDMARRDFFAHASPIAVDGDMFLRLATKTTLELIAIG